MNKDLEDIKNKISEIIGRKVTAEDMKYITIWVQNYNYDLDIIGIFLCIVILKQDQILAVYTKL